MPIYLVETNDGRVRQVIRAACAQCARSAAVVAAGAEGTTVWRDATASTVKEIKPDGPRRGVILRLDAPPTRA